MQPSEGEAEATTTEAQSFTGMGSCIEASLQYLSPPPSKTSSKESGESEVVEVVPLYQASEAGNRTEAIHDGNYTSYKVSIANGRLKQQHENFTLDKQGFQLLSHKSDVQDFYSDKEIKSIYEQEVTEVLKQITNCQSVIIFDHTRRSSSPDERQLLNCREPSSVVHNDYTEWSATKRLRDILGNDEDKAVNDIFDNNKRFAIINVWRPINGEVETWPLCLCDSTTVDDDKDLVSVKRISKDRIGEIQMSYYSSNHKWYYYPNMTKNEIILIKTYDSSTYDDTTTNNSDDDDDDDDATSNKQKIKLNRYTIHSAFKGYSDSNDDDNRENQEEIKRKKPRQSIETRAFCIY